MDPPPAHLPRIASLDGSADGPPLPPVRTHQQLSVHTPPTSFHGVTANLELKHVLNTSMGQHLTGSCRPRRLYGSESPPPNPQKSLNQVSLGRPASPLPFLGGATAAATSGGVKPLEAGGR